MDQGEFLGEVQRRAGLASVGEAEAATRATLVALGEYLIGYEGLDLALRLPEGLAETLRREPPDRPQIFSFNDFLLRVGEEEGTNPDDEGDPNEVLPRARAVVSVLVENLDADEAEDLRRQFPSEFDPLFE